jgi:hypothetical protein
MSFPKPGVARRLGWCAMLALVVAPACQAAAEFDYVGTKNCKKCHMKEFNSWSQTKMAKAFSLLQPGAAVDAKAKAKLDPKKDYTGDATCLACHTTGYGKPGGFVSIAKTPDMAGVGCESCHGPGGAYTKKEHMSLLNKEYKKAALVAVGLVGEITKEQCVSCHNANSAAVVVVGTRHFFKEFDFERRKAEDTHKKFPLKYKH